MKTTRVDLEKDVVQGKAAGPARRGRIARLWNRGRKGRQRRPVPQIFSKRGEGYIDVCVLVLCSMLVIALAVQVLPVFRVGGETSRRAAVLTEQTGLSPHIAWSKTGNIQLNEEITVTLTLEKNIGLFGGLGSFPITLRAGASGKSEVHHK